MPKAIYSQNLSSLAYCKRAQFQIEEIESGSNSPGLPYIHLGVFRASFCVSMSATINNDLSSTDLIVTKLCINQVY